MIRTENLTKTFRTEEIETMALNKVNLQIAKGEFVAIMGAFGLRKINLVKHFRLVGQPPH